MFNRKIRRRIPERTYIYDDLAPEWVRLYTEELYSAEKISQQYNISKNTIAKYLKRNGVKMRNKNKRLPTPEELLQLASQQNNGIVPRPVKQPLVLAYELTWRTDEDKKFMSTTQWKNMRKAVLLRDDFTCSYCGYKTDNLRLLHIHHVDGVPQNHDFPNLDTICNHCHIIMHSGLWATVYSTLDIYEKASVSQEEVIRITRELREQGKTDKEIIKACGLKKKVGWVQDLDYLKNKVGFVTSRRFF